MSEAAAEQRSVPTPFEALGGEAGVRRLTEAFYDLMDEPEFAALRAMHAADLSPMRVRLADWLSGWLGGPAVYNARHPGRGCIMSAHAVLDIGPEEAGQWVACMTRALDRAEAPTLWRKPLETAFARLCEAMQSR